MKRSDQEIGRILTQVVQLLTQYLKDNQAGGLKVAEYQPAVRLKEKFDWDLPEQGGTLDELIPAITTYLENSVRTGSPQFLNLLFSGFSLPGIIGELVTSATNTTMHTYEVAPVATLIEIELIQALNGLIGFPDGEGVMVTGGSNANMIGMLCARQRCLPQAQAHGVGSQRLVAFVSASAHYSYQSAANVLGIGRDNVLKVETDGQGCMLPQQLENAIQSSLRQRKQPFFVGATAGTTVLGAFDPIPALARVAEKYGLWLHVDGAWGAPVLFSVKHKRLLAGSALADSFTWDAHKLMGVPLVCSAILVKHKGILRQSCSGGGTEYLFHPEDENAAYNLGPLSLQCGRKVDALKLWLCWKYYGHTGYARRVDSLFELANAAVAYIHSCEQLELLVEPQFLNICFRYIPRRPLSDAVVDQLNLQIRQHLLQTGKAFVNYAHQLGRVWFRLILANPELKRDALYQFFQDLIVTGEQYEVTLTQKEAV